MFGLRRKCPEGQSIFYPVEDLVDYPEQIFKPYQGIRLGELLKSIRGSGILTPVIVRDMDDYYQILSGHNRVRAAKIIRLKYVPVYNLGELSDEEAMYVVMESNIAQRGFMEMSISERAKYAYHRYHSAKECGYLKNLIDLIDLVGIEKSKMGVVPLDRREVEDGLSLSNRSMRRYIRIHQLIDGLKSLLDCGQMPINAGVNLSFFDETTQVMIHEVITELDFKMSVAFSVKLRIDDSEVRLTEERLRQMIRYEMARNNDQSKRVSIRRTIIQRYFMGYERHEIEAVVEEALELWFASGDRDIQG